MAQTKPGRRGKRGRKKIIASIAVVLVVIVLVGKNMARGNKEEPVETVTPRIGTIIDRLTETGSIELLRTVEVKSKIAGTVREIYVQEGDQVTGGQTLCVVDPDPSQTLLLFQKRAAVDRTRIDLERARKEMERMRELSKTSMVSEKELEDAENAFLLAQNSYSLAQQELEIMEKEIETSGSGTEERVVASVVRAPYDGYVTMRYVEEGSVVTSGMSSIVSGTNLMQIGDPSTMIITTNISEVDIGKVDVGDDVVISLDAYPDTSFAGVIRHISPVGTIPQGRNVVAFNTEVEIIDKDPRLKPGMSCDVDVIIARADSTLYLPIEAIYEKREGSEEDDNLTMTRIVYFKTGEENPEEQKKGLFGVGEKPDPYRLFEERTVSEGIRSESRVQILADMDTTTVVAANAEEVYEALNEDDEDESDDGNEEGSSGHDGF